MGWPIARFEYKGPISGPLECYIYLNIIDIGIVGDNRIESFRIVFIIGTRRMN